MTEATPATGCPIAEGVRGWLGRNLELAAVVLVAVVAFYARSWEGDLHGDPVRYAAIAKTMLATGDWLTPQDVPGLLYANKPPLMMWLVALDFRLFGASTAAAVFWSCLFGVMTCVMVFLAGRRFFGATAGALGGCLLAITPGMITNAQDLRLDSTVALAAAVAVYAAVRAADENRPSWLLLAGVAGGLGFMTKMAAGAHVPALLVLVLAVRRPRLLVHPCFFGALLLGAAIAAPWHIAMMTGQHGQEFTSTYFGREMGERLVLGKHAARNFAASARGLAVWTFPWWLLAAYALFRWRRSGPQERAGLLVALLWIGEVFVFALIPRKHYDRYLTTAYPAIALLAGCGLAALLPERVRSAAPRLLRWLAVFQAFVMALLPIPMHTYRCKGFVEARQMLDRLAPGPTIAFQAENAPAGPIQGDGLWSPRAKVRYYLDRTLVNYPQAEDLAKSNVRFVIVRDTAVPRVVAAGYEEAFALDESYRLLQRLPAAAPPRQP